MVYFTHTGSQASNVPSVNCRCPEPSAFMIQICWRPVRFDRKTISVPLGDQLGVRVGGGSGVEVGGGVAVERGVAVGVSDAMKTQVGSGVAVPV